MPKINPMTIPMEPPIVIEPKIAPAIPKRREADPDPCATATIAMKNIIATKIIIFDSSNLLNHLTRKHRQSSIKETILPIIENHLKSTRLQVYT